MRERIDTTFRALRSRNFRLFLFGQGISLIGTWMQRVALHWLVYEITGSALMLGVVGFASHIPLLAAPLAGVILDRYSKNRVIIVTQILAMAQAFLLAYLVLSGQIEVWHIIVLSLVLGAINAFDVPGRQSFYVQLIDKKEDLQNAIALNSIIFHASQFIGPSIAGILIATYSEGVAFLINGLSYIPVIISLLLISVKFEAVSDKTGTFLSELKEGFKYISSSPPLKNILFLVAAISIMGWSYNILFPIFAKDVLGGDAKVFGFLTAASSIGAILSAFYAASRKNLDGANKRAVFFAGVFGAALIIFAVSKNLWLSIIAAGVVGLGSMLHNTSAISFYQNLLSEDKRGRSMSFYVLAHRGLMPVGSLLLGFMASSIGAPAALVIGGSFCVLVALFFAPRIFSSKIR